MTRVYHASGDIFPTSMNEKAKAAYKDQKRAAKKRGIAWMFTPATWWDWWHVEERWSKRGHHKGCLVMARDGNAGPFSPENARCITAEDHNKGRAPGRHRPQRTSNIKHEEKPVPQKPISIQPSEYRATEPVCFRITSEFKRDFKVYAAQHGLKLNELLRRAFYHYRDSGV